MRPPPAMFEPKTLKEIDALMQEEAGAIVLEIGSLATPLSRSVGRVHRAVAAELVDRAVTFARIRADRHPTLIREFRVRSIPTILFILDGEVLDATMGRVDEARLAKNVDWLIQRAEGEGFFARLLRRRA